MYNPWFFIITYIYCTKYKLYFKIVFLNWLIKFIIFSKDFVFYNLYVNDQINRRFKRSNLDDSICHDAAGHLNESRVQKEKLKEIQKDLASQI